LKTILTVWTVLFLAFLTGCSVGPSKKGVFVSVDFQKGQTLLYKFVSNREIMLDWDPTKSAANADKKTVTKSSEAMEMVVAYEPVAIDPYGLTTVKAICKSIHVKRSPTSSKHQRQKDAVETLVGKSFTFSIDPTGKVADYSGLKKLIQETGEKAFRPPGKRGRIKDPDMIGDFIATQWFLWDAISSIENPTEGLSIGQFWKSQLSVPNPMMLRRTRNVTYTLKDIRKTENGRIAVIACSYSPGGREPKDWPFPYSGRFQVSGLFGFLGTFIKSYNILELKGQGEELFNLDTGRLEKCVQDYQVKIEAATPSPLGTKPQITIKQKLTTQLLGQ